MELGKARYGSSKTVFKVEDGDNVFRILPPMGKLAKAGKWNMYYRVEWGYKNSAGKNRPFQDVRQVNYQTKMVEVESAAHLRREALAEEKKQLVDGLKKNPKDAKALARVKEIGEELKRYNLDAKYYMNAIDLNGKIGLLKVGSRAFKALKAEIDKLRKKGVDPLSIDNGRFFNFNRSNETGSFQDTQYQVTVYQENVEVNGETYQKDKVHKIDESIIARLADEAFELSGMYPEITAEEVARIVEEGSSAVDEILGNGNNQAAASEDDSDDAAEEVVETKVEAKAEAKVEKKAEAKVEPKAAAKAETKTETKTESAPASKGGDLSDDEFLKSIGAI